MIDSQFGLAVRQVRARRLRALLTSFGIVLGVGMVFGVLLLSGTIRATFDDLINSAWGSKDLIVTPRGGTMPDRTIDLIQSTPGTKNIGAMAGGVMVRLDASGTPIHGAKGRINVAGWDPKQPAPYDFTTVAGRAPISEDEIFVERNWARDAGIKVGDRMPVATAAGPTRVNVVGIFKFSEGLNFGGEGLGGMPLSAVRRLFDVPHGWHQISLQVTDRTKVAEVQRALQRRLGSGVDVKTPAGLGNDIKSQLSALNVVLYFFAGIALFVGGFLILNSFSMTVAQRIRELGMLRTIGASRQMIRRSVLIEAALLGAAGTLLGLGLGLGLASGLIVLIRGLGIPVGSLRVSPGSVVLAAALGLVATSLGAWWPARRAARTSPIQAAQGQATARARQPRWRLALGVALYVPGVIWGGTFWFNNSGSSSSLHTLAGVGMTMAMFVGMVLTAPTLITPVIRMLSVPLRRFAPTSGRLAADAARRNPARTASTAIALTIGLSVIVVNSAMSASFVQSVNDRIDRTFQRDVTVQSVGVTPVTAGSRPIDPEVTRAVAALPDAGVVSPFRMTSAQLPGLTGSRPYGLIDGVDPATIGAVDRPLAHGIADAAVPQALARGEALVANGYAKLRHLSVGSRLTLTGPAGRRTLLVAGITDTFNDFGGNTIRMSAATMQAIYGHTGVAQLLLRASAPDRRAALTREVETMLRKRFPELEALSTAQVKHDTKQRITQQFALFNSILAIAVIVSLLGVVNTLAMSVVERTREIGVLRALGSSRWLVRVTMLQEGLLITLAGAAAGLVLGALIALAWVGSLDSLLPGIAFQMPVGTVVAVALAAVVLGTLAAVVPARRAARLDVVDALAYE